MRPNQPSHPVNEEIASRMIRHGVRLQEYSTHQVYQMIGYLNRHVEPDLVEQLRKYAGQDLTRRRIEAIREAVGQIVSDGYERIRELLEQEMLAQGVLEAQEVMGILSEGMPVEVSWTMPSVGVLREAVLREPIAGEFVPDWFARLSLNTQQAIQRQIMLGVIEGEGIDTMIRRIVGTRGNQYTDGVMERSRRELEAVVRTAVAGVSDHVHQEIYQANADVIQAVQWVATLDSRTCVVCGLMDGQTFEIGQGPRAPAHWNCRCVRVPVLKSWKQLGLPLKEGATGTRAGTAIPPAEVRRLRRLGGEDKAQLQRRLDGQPAESLTYGQWLKRQSRRVQEEVLGKECQVLGRGKLKLEAFVVDRRRVRTLKELGAKKNA